MGDPMAEGPHISQRGIDTVIFQFAENGDLQAGGKRTLSRAGADAFVRGNQSGYVDLGKVNGRARLCGVSGGQPFAARLRFGLSWKHGQGQCQCDARGEGRAAGR